MGGGVTTAWGTVLKGSSIREIEYHCLKCSTTFQKNTTRWEQAFKHMSLQETVHISTTLPSYLQHPGNCLYPRSHGLCLIVKAYSRLGQVVLCKFILFTRNKAVWGQASRSTPPSASSIPLQQVPCSLQLSSWQSRAHQRDQERCLLPSPAT